MRRRQTEPSRWLIISGDGTVDASAAAIRLPRGNGVLLLKPLGAAEMRRLKHIARSRGLVVAVEGPRTAARVHNLGELRGALLRRTPFILLSPLNPTLSHPNWPAIPRMRAAALARLAGRKPVALGGMNDRRYAKVAPLGFTGWAGISAFRT